MTSTEVKALFFDSGGVLGVSTDPVGYRTWAARLGTSIDELRRFEREAVGPGWQGGRSEDEIRRRFRELTGISEEEHLRYDVDTHAHLEVEPSLREFITRARARYRVGVITNNGPHYRTLVAPALGLDQLVDDIVVSCEVGVSKPDPRIYTEAARRLGVAPQECVFVDDASENVEAAIAIGMRGVVFEDPDQCLTALRMHLGVIEVRYRAAGGVVFDDDGRVLVLRRTSRGEVLLPKGHIEAGEADDVAAMREVGEESGYIDLVIDGDLGVRVVEFDTFAPDRPGWHVIREEHYFKMRCRSDKTITRAADDLAFEPAWIDPRAAIDAMTYDAQRERVVQALA